MCTRRAAVQTYLKVKMHTEYEKFVQVGRSSLATREMLSYVVVEFSITTGLIIGCFGLLMSNQPSSESFTCMFNLIPPDKMSF